MLLILRDLFAALRVRLADRYDEASLLTSAHVGDR